MIPYPEVPSEHEVQTALFNLLRKNGVDARCQVMSLDRKCLFDVVVYRDKKAFLIIEVKKSIGKRGSGSQIHKYRQYGIKAVYCQGMGEIKACVRYALNKITNEQRLEAAAG